ncbi:nectin-4 isoform X1 [Oryzias latipes]|uniref:nectin-4 isoform X1 n=1 Tax=Oryzias latipes TaxID=8090 RepID=UPI0005CB921E|nr:nectin-4 isoform X1 [Oryzias latipes]
MMFAEIPSACVNLELLPRRRMTSLQTILWLCLWALHIFDSHQTFVNLPRNRSIQSLTEKETVLPCVFQPGQGNSVVQVTWLKKTTSAQPENIITAHRTDGQTVFPKWAQRVGFKSKDPLQNSSLIIMTTDISDEGIYICRIVSFPDGNFDTEVSLKVWTIPITSLDPFILVEGQPSQKAASCRSSGHPAPRLSWDTELLGSSDNRSFSGGVVSIQFSLSAKKSMNGEKLDCLVWHPAFSAPKRIKNNLVVHFVPHAEVTGYNNSWLIGMKNVALNCLSGGNPKPQNVTWTRMGGQLPMGAKPHPDGRLEFVEPMSSMHEGTYQCTAANTVGEAKAQVEVTLKEPPLLTESSLILIVAVVSGILLLMVILVISVSCYHKRKNRKLKKELKVKTEEVTTLTRQASVRRISCVTPDSRGPVEEFPLKVSGVLRQSQGSLAGQARCRESMSTISAFDSLGRPAIPRGERYVHRDESMCRVEEYVRSSVHAQKAHYYHPHIPPTYTVGPPPDGFRHLNGGAVIPSDAGSRQGSVLQNLQNPPMSYDYTRIVDEEDVDEGLGGPASQEHPDDQDSVTNSFHVSDAHSS